MATAKTCTKRVPGKERVNNDDRPRLLRLLLVVLMFHLHNSICTRHYLHHPVIVPPSKLPWQKLYDRANPTSFLHMTGLTQEYIIFVVLGAHLAGHD
jgi:hypothetical protein